MDAGEGLDAVEYFVLGESDGTALLWELAAGWTGNGTNEQRMEAVPVLRDAVISLVTRGLIEVRDFPSWPPRDDQAVPVAGADLDQALADRQNWLWSDGPTSLLTASLTDSGVPYL